MRREREKEREREKTRASERDRQSERKIYCLMKVYRVVVVIVVGLGYDILSFSLVLSVEACVLRISPP